jgi:predicted amidophosphoribosyltransferase
MGLQTQYLNFRSEKIPHHYLCNYRPVSAGLDELSKSLLNFKCGYRPDTAAWIECSILELEKIKIEKGCVVLRALASQEQGATVSTALDRLASELANARSLFYIPSVLKKIRKTRQVKLLTSFERNKELDSVYVFALPLSSSPPKEILILDDIVTTGATMLSIVFAIRKVLTSATIRIFTLASTDREAHINKSIQLSGYNFGWENERGWIAAEGSSDYHVDFEALKSKILTDGF